MPRREPYTRRMVYTAQTVSVRMPLRIVRKTGPIPGLLYFDDLNHLVLINEVGGMTHDIDGSWYSWWRVFTNGELSKLYRGHWIKGRNVVKERKEDKW
jgi:hypothetical protein